MSQRIRQLINATVFLSVILFSLNVIDCITSYLILLNGGLEINPVFFRFNSSGITIFDVIIKLSMTLLVILIIYFGICYAIKENSIFATYFFLSILIVLVIFFLYVCVVNWSWLRVYVWNLVNRNV